jgi:Uncharacterized conserved protein (COG2071)
MNTTTFRSPGRGFATPSPELHGLDAATTLVDVAITTFAVDPVALAARLPPGVEPDVVMLDDGRARALVSAVTFRDLDFRLALASALRFSFVQTNYRAYVRVGDRRLVWFFGTSLDSPLVAVPRVAWRMPWHGGTMRLDASWDGDRCTSYRQSTHAAWGAAEVELDGTGEPVGRLDGFADRDEGLLVLTHPLDGLGGYSVWHERFAPRLGIARTAHFELFERLGLVEPGAEPHSVMLQRTIDFAVLLPPLRFRSVPS